MELSFVLPLLLTSFISSRIPTDNSCRREVSTQLHSSSKPPQQLGEFQKLTISDTLLGHPTDHQLGRYVRIYDFSKLQPVQYTHMWELQKRLVQNHLDRLQVEFQGLPPASQFLGSKENVSEQYERYTVRDLLDNVFELDTCGKGRDCIILCQHEPVYTLGTGSDAQYVKLDEDKLESLGIDIVRIERGGEVTYHGPGQLTVYPILDLRGYKKDIHWYMRALEEAIIIALGSVGVEGAVREKDVTGVWVDNKKVAALGVKVKRWVTMHGLAVNVEKRSLENFEGIVPCGLEGRDVACVNDFLEENISVGDFALHLRDALQKVFEIDLI